MRGKNEEEVSEELRALLHYFEQTTDINAEHAGSERIWRIHERVQKIKMSEEVGVKYMQAWEERYFIRQEAREEGREEGREDMLKDIVLRMMKNGHSLEMIAETIGEPEEKIEKLLK